MAKPLCLIKMELKPTEYYYLDKPLISDGGVMLKLTLQDLCLRNILTVDQKWVQVDRKIKRERLRLFFSAGSEFDNYRTIDSYENLFLKPFENKAELGFSVIRQYLKFKLDKDVTNYKNNFVFPDIKRKGLCKLKVFPTRNGLKLKNETKKKLEFIELSIDNLLEKNKSLLLSEIESLNSNILFLKKETLSKLNILSDQVAMISKIEFLSNSSFGFEAMGSIFASDSAGFVDTGSGDFWDYGDGDFGGGGAGGDW